jgi:hypothetical protein
MLLAIQSAPAGPGMSTEEYLSVLASIIVGLGISHLLTGVGNLLADRARVRGYWARECGSAGVRECGSAGVSR